jgi:hypothetical protein
MAATFYLVQLAENTSVKPLDANALIVCAESEQEAKDIAASRFSYDSDTAWDDATVTELTGVSDLEGLVMVVQIVKVAGVTTEFRYTMNDTDTWDDAIDAMVALMAADSDLDDTSNEGSGVLRVAAADSMGDKTINSWVEYNDVRITDMDPTIDAVTTAGTKRDITFDDSLLRPNTLLAVRVVE